MKKLSLAIIAVALIYFDASAQETTNDGWGPVTNGIRLRIRLDEETITETNRGVGVVFEITNVAAAEVVYVTTTSALLDYTFVGSSPTKKALILKAPTDRSKFIFPRWSEIELKRGAFTGMRMNLADGIDLNETGTYKITAKRKITLQNEKKEGREAELVSNEIEIKVVEK